MTNHKSNDVYFIIINIRWYKIYVNQIKNKYIKEKTQMHLLWENDIIDLKNDLEHKINLKH